MIVGRATKFIDLPLPELYDLSADPAEAHNLVAEAGRPRAVAQGPPRRNPRRPRRLGAESGRDGRAAAQPRISLRQRLAPGSATARMTIRRTSSRWIADLQRVVALYQQTASSTKRSPWRAERRALASRRCRSATSTSRSSRARRAATTSPPPHSRRPGAAGSLTETLASRLGLLYSAQRKSTRGARGPRAARGEPQPRRLERARHRAGDRGPRAGSHRGLRERALRPIRETRSPGRTSD